MWYPTLPHILDVHEHICASTGVRTEVLSMEAVERAMIESQRLASSSTSGAAMAEKAVALMGPLIQGPAFAHGTERVAFAVAQVVLHSNGYTVPAPIDELDRFFLRPFLHDAPVPCLRRTPNTTKSALPTSASNESPSGGGHDDRGRDAPPWNAPTRRWTTQTEPFLTVRS